MDEEKEIQEIAKDLNDCQHFSDIYGYQTDYVETARSLYWEGYRKPPTVESEILSYIKRGVTEKIKDSLSNALSEKECASFHGGMNIAYQNVVAFIDNLGRRLHIELNDTAAEKFFADLNEGERWKTKSKKQ